jgi:myosin heavy subunit
VIDVTRTRISIKSLLNGKTFVFATDETNRVASRVPLPPEGVNDMITMSDLSEASILWNIKIRYDHRQFYVGIKNKKFSYFYFSRNS